MRDELHPLNEVKKFWWLHDSFWHATLVREYGHEKANALNLEANERFFRMLTLRLLKQGIIKKPQSIQELMEIFKTIWATCFFDEMYIHNPITYYGNTAIWTSYTCHAFDSLTQAQMTEGYSCGCQAIRNGVMRALRLNRSHSIEESLIEGHGRCVIKIHFESTKVVQSKTIIDMQDLPCNR